MPPLLVFAVCAFASGFALRLADPIVLPVAAHFAIAPTLAAALSTAYALPYALAQPVLGPLGDRFGKARCIQVCVAGLAVALGAGALAPSFPVLVTTRIAAGICAGGLIPLVLAAIGDRYAMEDRQVMIGRMLFAIISGQMLGSMVSGFANDRWGWHSSLVIGAAIGVAAATVAWTAMRPGRVDADSAGAGVLELYRRVFASPKAPWLYGCVLLEGALFYGIFPYMGELLLTLTRPGGHPNSVETGLVLGAFGIGGLLYAASVRRLLRWLGVRRMCAIGATIGAAGYLAIAYTPLWWLDAATMLLVGVAFYMLHSSLQTEATELAPSARGSAVALFACGFFLGQGLGPLVFGALLRGLGPAAALALVAVALIAVGLVAVTRIVERPGAPLAAPVTS